jgi:hypothetical protein
VAATPTAGGVGGAALAGGGRPSAHLRPEQPPLERQPVVERELRDAGWLLQLIAWTTWPSDPAAASKGLPRVWPLAAPVPDHRAPRPSTLHDRTSPDAPPLHHCPFAAASTAAAASELSAGCRRPGAGSGQPGRSRAYRPQWYGPRPSQAQGGSMSRLTRGLVRGATLVLSRPGSAGRSAGAHRGRPLGMTTPWLLAADLVAGRRRANHSHGLVGSPPDPCRRVQPPRRGWASQNSRRVGAARGFGWMTPMIPSDATRSIGQLRTSLASSVLRTLKGRPLLRAGPDREIHPIPTAITEPNDLGKRWLAWRSTVDL